MTPSVLSRRSKLIMLSGVSAVALSLSLPASAQTLSGLRSAMGLPGQTSGANGSAPAPGAAALPASALTPAQAAQQTTRSTTDLNNAISALKAQLTIQANAQAAAQAAAKGLVNSAVPVAAHAISTDPSLWQGANAPTQSTANGLTTVTIDQTQSKAILTWDSFNVGPNTVVHFDQTGGTQTDGSNTWIALNRIVDPSGKPSQILGQIQAEGSVYLINRNGIVFGSGSQVNVHSLVASSLSFLTDTIMPAMTPGSPDYDAAVAQSNATFLATGIDAPGATNLTPVLGLSGQISLPPGAYQAPGDITIAQGASITTHANGTQGDGGFALIAGTNVTNAGVIDTPDGQAILAAGLGVSFSVRQSAANVLNPVLTGQFVPTGTLTDVTPVSTLTNTGLVEAARGAINLLGTNVTQGGVVAATTGVSYPGSIVITAADEGTIKNNGLIYSRAGVAEFTAGSVTANLPEEDGETATSSPTSTFTPGSITVTGGSPTFDNGSLVEAPGAKVSVAGLVSSATGTVGPAQPGEIGAAVPPVGDTAVQGRIYIDNGAVIDVAGLADVELPVSATLVTIPLITQNDIADNPNQAALLGLTNLIVDASLAGTTSTGFAWVGTPILGASGYAQLVPRKIDQLLTNAGSILLSGNEVLTASGSMLNLDGGYVHYLGGMVSTTDLIDASGHVTPIGQANPNDVYVGVAGETTVDHRRWGVTDTYVNPLLSGSLGYYQAGYVAGGNAGVLTVFGESAVVLDGDISAHAVPGLKQAAAGAAPSGTAGGGGFLPTGGTFDLGDGGAIAFQNDSGADPNQTGRFIIQNQAPALTGFDPGFNAATPFDATALNALDPNDPNNILSWRTIPADTLSAGGFANVTINAGDGQGLVVAEGATLQVQPGGSISYKSGEGPITVLGRLIAPSGTISLETDDTQPRNHAPTLKGFDITIGSQAVLSTAGLWVNDSNLITASGASAFVNGGTIRLFAPAYSTIDLEQGGVLDVSSGGVLLQGGLLSSNGVPVGKGGNVTLSTWNIQFPDQFPTFLPTAQPTTGGVILDGTIKSWGFSGGGTFALQTLGIQIGADAATAPAGTLVLPTDFFANQGFGNYQLNALYDATVADGAQLRLTQQNLTVPRRADGSLDLSALRNAPTGADITESGLTTPGTLDAYYRQATNLTLTAGGDVAWLGVGGGAAMPQYAGVTNRAIVGAGAEIEADAGASITLGGSDGVTVLGSITAPGGSITLTGDSDYVTAAGLQTHAFTSPDKSLWLGSDAVLDVAGIVLTNPFATPVNMAGVLTVPITGKVLNGGSVTLSTDTGAIVAEAGSVIDVSGTSASFDLPQIGADGAIIYAPQPVWSNAGSITLGASRGLFFDGTLKAEAGAPQAEGGALTLEPLIPVTLGIISTYTGGTIVTTNATGLIVQQSGDLATGLELGQPIVYTDPGMLRFAADRLDGSGISTLVLGAAATNQNSRLINPVPVAFAGDVSLSLAKAVVINASQIEALPAGATSIPTLAAGSMDTGGATVTLTAPYVAIAGPAFQTTPLPTVAAAGDGVLNVEAGFLDIENQTALANFGQTNLTSHGDIRLSSVNGDTTSGTPAPGVLFTTGDLTLKAADIYPASGETFILDAVGPKPTTLTIQANGASSTPLSAGGALLIDATDIVQSGTLRAPFGGITLGVGDPGDADTETAFENLPLTATRSVQLADGSITSVSADGATLPYGVTTDGTNWSYPGVPNAAGTADLTAPPAKIITVNGTSVSLAKGATIDLSGGGELQAEEWTPGTGGTRDLLSQYNISYAGSTTGQTIPLYPDARNVYAIVPGYSAPVAAYDPVFAQTPGGAQQGQTTSLGVGQAGTGDLVGKAVYLAGVPGLPAGVYTLLPAKYATLPGAFRVVQETSAANVVAGSSSTLIDGTHVVSGYFADALTGAKSSIASLFDVQSASVWGKYSQYTLTQADTFFANQAAAAGTATPALPRDAGSLTLAASGALTLGATLDTAAASGGAPAQVNVAAQDIQIVGQGEAALPGYLQIKASDLDALNAGSLLIGGTRTQTSSGVTLNVISNSVVVSNDAANPLTGPEILLVAKADGSNPNAADGLRVDSGSVITAVGALPASADQAITIGSSTVSGDGALLRISQGGQVDITRNNVPTSGAQGSLTVAAGAVINGGAALTLDSSGALSFDPTASFSGVNIAVDAPSITLTGTAGSTASGFVVGPENFAQFAKAQAVSLRSYGAITFDGDVALTFGQAVELSAGDFISDGGTVDLTGSKIAFTNDLNAPAGTAAAGQGSLSVDATEIDLGTGAKSLSGFGSVKLTATGGIVGQDSGSLDAGAAAVTLSAPAFLADTGSDTSLKTTGALTLAGNSGTGLNLTPLGGAIGFTGGSVMVDHASIEAPAGDVSLEATSGDLVIASGSTVSSAGAAKAFFDTTQYAPAGAIKLLADHGALNVQSGAVLDFSGAQGGGAAGSLTLSSPDQSVQLAGTIKGNAAQGYLGGSLSLDTGGAVDLDNLATLLASSGVDDTLIVHSRAGNLVLSAGDTLKAQSVTLTADGGAGGQDPSGGDILIAGTIDASGNKGGSIDLYGRSGVDLEGSLLAVASGPLSRGGAVEIGVTGVPTTSGGQVQLNPTYGYELVSAANSGVITLGAHAMIDVTGGVVGTNGTVNFRAPLLDNGDVNVNIAAGAQIKGSRATTLEAYAVWSTDDPLTDPVTGGAKHFDGIVDPAGWYGADGVLVPGVFTNGDGTTVATWDGSTLTTLFGAPESLADYLAGTYAPPPPADPNTTPPSPNVVFTPTAANADHQTFYGYKNGDADAAVSGTLMAFVENFPISSAATARFAGVAHFAVTPGIELDNPDPNINGGNITVLTNWNLGAGSVDASGAITNVFRYNGQAPVITFKAENDFKADASLTDGFFQLYNPLVASAEFNISAPSLSQYGTFAAAYDAYYAAGGSFTYFGPGKLGGGVSYYANAGSRSVSGPQNLNSADPALIDEYYALYVAYAQFLDTPLPPALANYYGVGVGPGTFFPNGDPLLYSNVQWLNNNADPSASGAPKPPSRADQLRDPTTYLVYLQGQYAAYILAAETQEMNTGREVVVAPLAPPLAQPGGATLAGGPLNVTIKPPIDNTPSPVGQASNLWPLLSASLAGGSSSSFRIAAGANLGSADPLAVQSATSFGAGDGSVTLDGHASGIDPNGQAINTPTMIRTGVGSITVAAAGDVSLLDSTAPGVIYAAGAPADGAPVGANVTLLKGDPTSAPYDLLATNAVNPAGGGDVSIRAGGDIVGVENLTAEGGAYSQFWWPWMETGNAVNSAKQVIQTSINFGAFDQGVMSVGGDVDLTAGGNIINFSASLPTTWYLGNNNQTVNVVGGGDLNVTAGGDILSGSYFVAKGAATITAGGKIASSGVQMGFGHNTAPIATVFATQDGVLNLTARQGVDIGAVIDPSYVQGSALANGFGFGADWQSYSASSALNAVSATGDVVLNSVEDLTLLDARNIRPGVGGDEAAVLPANVSLTAFSGGISVDRGGLLYPSASGELSLIADQTITLVSQPDAGFDAGTTGSVGLIDADASALPSPLKPLISDSQSPLAATFFDGQLSSAKQIDHSPTPLHADDTQPVRIYSLEGSIIAGFTETTGLIDQVPQVVVDKPAQIYAGLDIVNFDFLGQNLRQDDITRIVAGRDILTQNQPVNSTSFKATSLNLGGPGTFDVEAGRNISVPNAYELTGADPYLQGAERGAASGIITVGDANNPYLPHESADINVLFGVGPGVDNAAFISAYVDPTVATPLVQNALVAFMATWDAGQGLDTGLVKDRPTVTLTVDQAWSQFQALPAAAQALFNEKALFAVLTQVDVDYNDPASPFVHQYARGYQAINTLFPAALGYTANSLSGGKQGADTLVHTGDLDIRSNTIQTQQGGNITILGPGGQALVGAAAAPPAYLDELGRVTGSPSDVGVLTLEQGDINIFTDQSVLLAQSRIFTEQGGNMTMWSSNGDINAGKGAKTTADVPAPIYVCDDDFYCTLDARGEVTGAGIATLQTIPGSTPGNVYLVAPRGTVDAGAAGIRVSGDIFVAALAVANAANIQVQGQSFGLPPAATTNLALATPDAAAKEVAQVLQQMTNQQRRHALDSIVTVEVVGFGGDADQPQICLSNQSQRCQK